MIFTKYYTKLQLLQWLAEGVEVIAHFGIQEILFSFLNPVKPQKSQFATMKNDKYNEV